jgi:hypothetical protein
MKIVNGVLIKITEEDLDDQGRFINNDIKEIADWCFSNMLKLTEVVLPNCEKMGSHCFRSNPALTSFSLPALTTCGGNCFRDNWALISVSIYNKELVIKNVDGYAFVIERHRTFNGIVVYWGYNFYGIEKGVFDKKDCYVAEKDGFTAHGETLEKSVEDLLFKIASETLKKEPITADTLITVELPGSYRRMRTWCKRLDEGKRPDGQNRNAGRRITANTGEIPRLRSRQV